MTAKLHYRVQRIGATTYLEVTGIGFTLSVNLGSVDPASTAAVREQITMQATDAEFHAEKHLRRAKRLRAVVAQMDQSTTLEDKCHVDLPGVRAAKSFKQED